jgi:hypothetical protein
MASTKGRGSAATKTAKTANTAKSAKTARSSPKTAGKPAQESAMKPRAGRSAATAPSAAELDLRDRLKAQPRRPAGPPLVGDVVTREAMKALRDEVLPESTDPAGRGSRAKRS